MECHFMSSEYSMRIVSAALRKKIRLKYLKYEFEALKAFETFGDEVLLA